MQSPLTKHEKAAALSTWTRGKCKSRLISVLMLVQWHNNEQDYGDWSILPRISSAGMEMSELILGLKGLFITAKEHSFEVWKYRGHL